MNIQDIKNDDKFNIYYDELIDYNEKVNLTAITDKEEVFVKHFFDSCLGESFIPQNAKVVDVGTGAGFPGIPLKIIRPDINLHLVDSLNKRVVFLDYLKDKLCVQYSTYHARVETFALNIEHREKFDVCVSRAVAKLNTLVEYCLPLVAVGGVFIAYKGISAEAEVLESQNAIKTLGGEIIKIAQFDLPNDLGKRNLIVIRKINKCPKAYPRGKNLPKLRPL